MKKNLIQWCAQVVVWEASNISSNIRNELINLIESNLPSGSGFDNGTKINFDKSTTNKIVLETSFHHMSDDGFYDGWTYHTVTIKSDFLYGADIKVSGKDRNGIKDYISELCHYSLLEPQYEWNTSTKTLTLVKDQNNG